MKKVERRDSYTCEDGMNQNVNNRGSEPWNQNGCPDTGPRILRCAALLRRRAGKNVNMNTVHDICGKHSWVLNFLYEQEKAGIPVYQKDIEKVLSLTKSGVSRFIDDMEQKKIIERKSVDGDARLRQITLTDYGRRLSEYALDEKRRLEDEINAGFDKEDLRRFDSYLSRLEENLSKGSCDGKGGTGR